MADCDRTCICHWGFDGCCGLPSWDRAPEADSFPPFSIAAIVAAPPLETGAMIILHFCLGLIIWRPESLRIVVLAMILALAHALDGAWLRAALVFWPFCVYSIALVAWSKRSYRDAFLVVTAVHALHNATAIALIAVLASASHASTQSSGETSAETVLSSPGTEVPLLHRRATMYLAPPPETEETARIYKSPGSTGSPQPFVSRPSALLSG